MKFTNALYLSALTIITLSLESTTTRSREQDRTEVCHLILSRWSGRAFSGQPMTQHELEILCKAASWAPSCYNHQPWRFIYAHRGTPAWQQLFDLMVPFNQMWAENAAVLMVVVSKTTFDHVDAVSPSHSFDTGAACQNLALQAHDMGLVAHAMGGFDAARAQKALNIPEDFAVEVMIAVGHPADKNVLPEGLRNAEVPANRKPLEAIIFEGSM